jgi:DNA-binding GntR family transcriptional regulator
VISAQQLAKETGLSRGTVGRCLTHLVEIGLLSVGQGVGYTILRQVPRAETLLSITRLARERSMEVVSIADKLTSRRAKVSDSKREAALLELSWQGNDDILIFRRVRGLRPLGSKDPFQWSILETAYLNQALFPKLTLSDLTSGLCDLTDPNPTGNCSLHAMFEQRGIQPTKSEYTLSLVSGLHGNDEKAWTTANQNRPDAYRYDQPFLRLVSTTFRENSEAIEYSVTNLVPEAFTFGMTAFRLVPTSREIAG